MSARRASCVCESRRARCVRGATDSRVLVRAGSNIPLSGLDSAGSSALAGAAPICWEPRTVRAPRSLPNLGRHREPFMIESTSPTEPGLGVGVDAGQQLATLACGVTSQNLEPVVGG